MVKAKTVRITVPAPSAQGELNATDWKKVAKGAAIAAMGAIFAQLSIYLNTGVAFDWKIWLGGILSVAVNTAWKFVQSPPKQE